MDIEEAVSRTGKGTFEARARAHRAADGGFSRLTAAAAALVLVLLGGVVAALVAGAAPALGRFGGGFLTSISWNPVTGQFGALPALAGTLITSAIAMLVAVPLSFGVTFFLTELCPHRLRRPIGTAIELLAAIPSIIYGIWGLFVLVPLMQAHVEPVLTRLLGPLPLIGALFQGAPYGIGLLTAGLVLAGMVLPYAATVMRDAFEQVPAAFRESAYALGCTRLEVVRAVVIPYSRRSIVGGVMLGLGRALGETMAVTFVIGNAHRLSASLLAPGTTIAATLANEFTEASGGLYTSALLALGLVLLGISLAVLATAKLMLRRDTPAGGRPR